MVNIEPTLQKSADVPNVSTQADPSAASVPVSKQQSDTDVPTSPANQSTLVVPELVKISKTKKKSVSQKVFG